MIKFNPVLPGALTISTYKENNIMSITLHVNCVVIKRRGSFAVIFSYIFGLDEKPAQVELRSLWFAGIYISNAKTLFFCFL